ncbi:MAG: DUF418 domain-containing protein [Longimicrobiales bacterium]
MARQATITDIRAGSPDRMHGSAQVMTVAPIAETERISALDVLRGFALLGILLMNIQAFSMPWDAYLNPTAFGDLTGANRWIWMVTHVVADQKFISIFSLLFGAGIVLMTDRLDPGRTTAIHFRRMAILIAFGLLHAHGLWQGDILYAYGVCGLLVYPARKLPARRLILLGMVVLATGSLIYLASGLAMRNWPPEVVSDFTHEYWRSPVAAQQHELAVYRGGWLQQSSLRSPDALIMETFVFLFDIVWKVAGLMLIGMALFKLDVLAARRADRFYRRLLMMGLGLGLPTVLYGMWANFRAGWDVRYSFFFGSQFNYWGSVLVALGWIAALLLLCRSGRLPALQHRLAAIGRTAFSNYILQTVICTTIFYGHGFGLFGRVDRIGQLLFVFAIWSVQLVLAPVWLKHFAYGPLEWLWRSLTYGRTQPMRRLIAHHADRLPPR